MTEATKPAARQQACVAVELRGEGACTLLRPLVLSRTLSPLAYGLGAAHGAAWEHRAAGDGPAAARRRHQWLPDRGSPAPSLPNAASPSTADTGAHARRPPGTHDVSVAKKDTLGVRSTGFEPAKRYGSSCT